MKKIITALAAVTLSVVAGVSMSADAKGGFNKSNCTFNGKKLYGKIQEVSSFPDVKVQKVSSFPDTCGKWQMVSSFPDTKVQFVTSFPDVKVQYVTSFPGAN
jgi:hypothetical protein